MTARSVSARTPTFRALHNPRRIELDEDSLDDSESLQELLRERRRLTSWNSTTPYVTTVAKHSSLSWSSTFNMSWTSVLASSLSYATYPFAFLLSFLAVLLQTLAFPLLAVGRYFLQLSLFPFRIFAKFENLSIFFGTAVLIGLATGLILYFTSSFVIQLLQLSPERSEPYRPLARRGQKKKLQDFSRFRPRNALYHWKPSRSKYSMVDFGTDAQSPRAEASSAVKREKDTDTYYTPWNEDRDPREGGLLSTMILEEEDNSSERGGS